MKRCTTCGRDNDDDVIYCLGCGTVAFRTMTPARLADTSGEPPPAPPLPGEEHTGDQSRVAFVTLMNCARLWEADLIKSRLETAGIHVIIPDEFLMQVICWSLNTYGFVRLQVPTPDQEAARDLLVAMRDAPEVLNETRP